MNKIKIAIIGLGYVGLPLAIAFGKFFDTIGYDKNLKRILNLKKGLDLNNEVSARDFKKSKLLQLSNKFIDIKDCNYYIITVPTPIFKNKKPNLSFLIDISSMLSNSLKKNDIVIYESTVYPGATEEVCIPNLLKNNNLKFNQDFFVGYSPERINPGDKIHTLENIKKITSASNKTSLKKINFIYKKIIKAGIFPVDSIKIAEAAKVIENAQRDINVAFMNELSLIFKKLNINTQKVLEASSTKWNFLNFKPGLVGGHCIGVDPYYLSYRSQKSGYIPQIINSGRAINDSMPKNIVKEINQIVKNKFKANKKINILIFGLPFKENCVDTRNSKVFDIYSLLKKNNYNVDIYDPLLDPNIFYGQQNIKIQINIKRNIYDGAVIAVAHKEFVEMGIKKIKSKLKKNSFIYDIKSIFQSNLVDRYM